MLSFNLIQDKDKDTQTDTLQPPVKMDCDQNLPPPRFLSISQILIYQFQQYVHHAFVQFQVPDLSSSGSSWAGLQVAIWYVLNIAKKLLR